MYIDGTYYIDNSTLKAVARCDTDAFLTYVCGYKPIGEERAVLKSGSAFHEGLASTFRSMARGASAEHAALDGMNTLVKEYHEWATAEVPLDDRLGWDNISNLFNAWTEAHLPKLPFYFQDERMVEVGFAYPLDETGEFVFYGRMDGIAAHVLDDSCVVVEHKTTGRLTADWTNQWHMDSQVSGYVWAAQQHHPEVFGCLINAIETSKMPSDPTRKCPIHKTTYSECGPTAGHLNAKLIGPITRTPEQLEQWRRSALSLARRYKSLHEQLGEDPLRVGLLNMQGLFNNSCKWCNIKEFCTVGRPVDRFRSMFEYNPWMPYNPLDFLDAAG